MRPSFGLDWVEAAGRCGPVPNAACTQRVCAAASGVHTLLCTRTEPLLHATRRGSRPRHALWMKHRRMQALATRTRAFDSCSRVHDTALCQVTRAAPGQRRAGQHPYAPWRGGGGALRGCGGGGRPRRRSRDEAHGGRRGALLPPLMALERLPSHGHWPSLAAVAYARSRRRGWWRRGWWRRGWWRRCWRRRRWWRRW